MLEITVHTPIRTGDRYEFACAVRPVSRWRSRLRRHDDVSGSQDIHFGFTAQNFRIRHQPVWDSVYPLFFLTRNGGPLFNRGSEKARIRLDYPVSQAVAEFYVRRAASFGLEIEVRAPMVDVELEPAEGGRVLAFGGGKDSRMVLGVTRELGIEPRLMTAAESSPPDLPDAFVTHSIPGPEGVLANRIMPTLMQVPRHLYLGLGLGEAHLESPWQQYYDMASPKALAEWSGLFRQLGGDIEIHSPVSVLPYNITQRILCERYPELATAQASVRPGARTEKNLHVCLAKHEHGIDFSGHCTPQLFEVLLTEFVEAQIARPEFFGYRNHRGTFQREMRAIIWRHRSEPSFSAVRDLVPPEWDADWIDYVHEYVAPDLEDGFVEIYREYAKPVPEGSAVRRIRI